MPVHLIDILKPKNNGSFPVAEDTDLLGGWRVVGNLTARDAIPAARRKEGMWVAVISESKIYSLVGGVENTNWQEVVFGGGPTPTGNDGYAIIEIGGVAAFRPILQAYIQAAFAISAFGGPATQEVGATVASPSFTASYNFTPDTASVVDDQGNPGLDVHLTPTAFTYSYQYTKTANNAAVTWTLSAGRGTESATRTASVAWRPRLYYGVGVDGLHTESDIKGLASQPLAASRATTFTVNAGSGQHIYFASPVSYGSATFTIGGFEGGFDLVGTVSVTNANGVTQNYYLYKSTNPNLGSTTVQVS